MQYLPLVEAVPFFRRSINGKPKPNVPGKQQQALGGVSAAAAAVEVEVDPTAPASRSSSSSTEDQPTEVTPQKDSKKRKHSAISSSSSSSSEVPYHFPLMNGHDRFADNAEAPIPFRYLEAYRKPDVARKATITSLQWREQHGIDTILSRPNVNYDVAKRILPHYFIGHSDTNGYVVFVQRPGLSDLALAKHNDISLSDMLDQYAYVFEYCWNILHPHRQDDPNAIMISIIDLQGLDLSILRKRDLQHFVKEFVGMIDAHYPTRAYKTYMINAPKWFSGLYKIVSPIMRESTKEKIVLFSPGPAQDAALREGLGANMANLVQEALRVPDKQERKEKAANDLSLTSDILLDTDMEQQIRNFVSAAWACAADRVGWKARHTISLDNLSQPPYCLYTLSRLYLGCSTIGARQVTNETHYSAATIK